MNVKVHIQTRCEHCDGEAYLLVGEAIDANGNFYPRYLPCGHRHGSGEQNSWINRLEFLDLLGQ